jgi:hypothetical protein
MLLLERLATVDGSLMETTLSSRTGVLIECLLGDVTYWWIFGDECLMGMLDRADSGREDALESRLRQQEPAEP